MSTQEPFDSARFEKEYIKKVVQVGHSFVDALDTLDNLTFKGRIVKDKTAPTSSTGSLIYVSEITYTINSGNNNTISLYSIKTTNANNGKFTITIPHVSNDVQSQFTDTEFEADILLHNEAAQNNGTLELIVDIMKSNNTLIDDNIARIVHQRPNPMNVNGGYSPESRIRTDAFALVKIKYNAITGTFVIIDVPWWLDPAPEGTTAYDYPDKLYAVWQPSFQGRYPEDRPLQCNDYLKAIYNFMENVEHQLGVLYYYYARAEKNGWKIEDKVEICTNPNCNLHNDPAQANLDYFLPPIFKIESKLYAPYTPQTKRGVPHFHHKSTVTLGHCQNHNWQDMYKALVNSWCDLIDKLLDSAPCYPADNAITRRIKVCREHIKEWADVSNQQAVDDPLYNIYLQDLPNIHRNRQYPYTM